jgi:hypothetical protein
MKYALILIAALSAVAVAGCKIDTREMPNTEQSQ